MKVNEFAMLIGALVIVLAVCVPIMGQFAVQQTDTITVDHMNPTQYYAASMPLEGASLTITYNSEDQSATVAANGREVTIYAEGNALIPLAISGINCLRFGSGGDLRLYSDHNIVQNITSASISEGVLSVTRSSTTTTYDLTEDIWYAAPSGSYGIYNTFNANAASFIVANNFQSQFYNASTFLRYMATGTAEGMEILAAYASTNTSTTTDRTSETKVDYLLTTQGDGYVTVSGIHITSIGIEKTMTNAWFIAPVHYTATTSTSNIMSTLVGMAPVLLVVGLLMSVVAIMMRREDSIY